MVSMDWSAVAGSIADVIAPGSGPVVEAVARFALLLSEEGGAAFASQMADSLATFLSMLFDGLIAELPTFILSLWLELQSPEFWEQVLAGLGMALYDMVANFVNRLIEAVNSLIPGERYDIQGRMATSAQLWGDGGHGASEGGYAGGGSTLTEGSGRAVVQAGANAPVVGPTPNVVIEINALDSQSVEDRAPDIAAAIRKYMARGGG
jgi:hypothetical protein